MFETLQGTGWPVFLNITVLLNVEMCVPIEVYKCLKLVPVDRDNIFLRNAGNVLWLFLGHIPEGDRYKHNSHHRDCLKIPSLFLIVSL